MNSIPRHYKRLLIEKLSYTPAVVLLGARQVGKTTLSLQVAQEMQQAYLYLDLENTEDLQKIQPSPETYLNYHKDKLVILDEIQVFPKLMNSLRGLIDKNRENSRFIILGSASPHLVKGVSESLAGRVSYIDLPPFRLDEVYSDYSQQRHWLRGGFPLSFLAKNEAIAKDWLSSFVRSYVERDFNYLFGYSFNRVLARRLWSMLAFQQGSLLNSSDLSRSLGVTSPVVNRYIEFMEGAFLLLRLAPWFANTTKRLVKSPKIYIRDTGILHYFMSIRSFETLFNHPIVGRSWEGYVVEQISYHKSTDTEMFFYRTQVGAEIDLVLVQNNVPTKAIEIKFSNAPKVSKGFYIACNDLDIADKFIITPDSNTYPLNESTMVMSLWDFLKKEL